MNSVFWDITPCSYIPELFITIAVRTPNPTTDSHLDMNLCPFIAGSVIHFVKEVYFDRHLWGVKIKYLSVSRQVHSLFQTEFSKECDLELPLSTSSIFLFP
jgi:hypothetical protein